MGSVSTHDSELSERGIKKTVTLMIEPRRTKHPGVSVGKEVKVPRAENCGTLMEGERNNGKILCSHRLE